MLIFFLAFSYGKQEFLAFFLGMESVVVLDMACAGSRQDDLVSLVPTAHC